MISTRTNRPGINFATRVARVTPSTICNSPYQGIIGDAFLTLYSIGITRPRAEWPACESICSETGGASTNLYPCRKFRLRRA